MNISLPILSSFQSPNFLSGLSRMFNLHPTENNHRRQLETLYCDTINSFGGMISAICHSFANSEDDFEDLRQDALYNIWLGLPEFRFDSNIKSWIYRITLNTCVSTYRKPSRKIKKVEVDITDSGSVEEAGFENSQWLNKMLKTLNPIDRSIMIMWLDDFTYEKIAEVMGMNKNTVATRLHRAKLKLQDVYYKI